MIGGFAHAQNAPNNAAQTNAPYAMTVADARGMNSATTTSPTLVQCEPPQEAVLQRSIVANREVAQVTCVTRVAPTAYAAAPYATPVVYAQPDIVQRPGVRTSRVWVDDMRGSAWYRTQMVRVWVRRALEDALRSAGQAGSEAA